MRIRLSSFIVHLSSFALALALCGSASGAGITSLHSLESGTVSITNTQKNSSWHPIAILFRFEAPATGTLTVTRQTEGGIFQLSTITLSDNQYAVWLPEAPITFKLNNVLGITSTETNGIIEIIRKGE